MKILKIFFIFLLTITHSYSWSLFGKSALENCADQKTITSIINQEDYEIYKPFDENQLSNYFKMFQKNNFTSTIIRFDCGSDNPKIKYDLCDLDEYIKKYPEQEMEARQHHKDREKKLEIEKNLKVCTPSNNEENCTSPHSLIEYAWGSLKREYDFITNIKDMSLKEKLNNLKLYESKYKKCEIENEDYPKTFRDKWG